MRYLPGFKVPTSVTRRNYTGDSSTTDFTISGGMSVDKLIVDVNGVVQLPTTNYTISGTTLTFDSAPVTGHTIHIIELPV